MAAEKTHPDYGEPFSRQLLKLVLGRNVGKLKVIPQNVYFASDVSLHGAILDAYLEEEDEGATVYDVEPEKDDHEEPSMCYDDGAVMIFLNAKGRPEGETRELCEFLRYAENSTLENAMSDRQDSISFAIPFAKNELTSACG